MSDLAATDISLFQTDVLGLQNQDGRRSNCRGSNEGVEVAC